MEAAPPATPRHSMFPLWLLPSGPDQVNGYSMRGDRWGHHNAAHQVTSRAIVPLRGEVTTFDGKKTIISQGLVRQA